MGKKKIPVEDLVVPPQDRKFTDNFFDIIKLSAKIVY